MLLNYHIGRLVLSSLCVGALVRLVLGGVRIAGWSTASACNTDTTQNQPHKISNTQRTETKATDAVSQQHSRKLLMMDILMSETCWAHKKWNITASDIKLVFYSSTIKWRKCLKGAVGAVKAWTRENYFAFDSKLRRSLFQLLQRNITRILKECGR